MKAWQDTVSLMKIIQPKLFDIKDENGNQLESKKLPSDFVPVEKQPKPIKIQPPVYPKNAHLNKIEGTVWVKLFVDASGEVQFVKVLETSNKIFNESALVAAMYCQFEPAVMGGKNIAIWVSFPYRYKLNH
jgi:TonB family protein